MMKGKKLIEGNNPQRFIIGRARISDAKESLEPPSTDFRGEKKKKGVGLSIVGLLFSVMKGEE